MVDSQVADLSQTPVAQEPDTQEPAAQEIIEVSAHPTIAAYFDSFNQANFEAVAALFAAEGQLLPPFEAAITGRQAIETYLTREAKGMQALPQQATQQILSSEETKIEVLGQVQTSLFSVNVGWSFVLNSESDIMTAKIKLLASLRDLLHLKPEKQD